MNSSIVRYILGHVLKIEAALMVIPVIVGVIYREKAISAFLITMALCAVSVSYTHVTLPTKRIV